MNKLDEICAVKLSEVQVRKAANSLADHAQSAKAQTPPRGFKAALDAKARSGFGLIAEI